MTTSRTSRRPAGEADSEAGGMMGFLEHLDELRRRIIYAVIALGAGMTVAFFFLDRIAYFVLGPTLRALPAGTKLAWRPLTAGHHGVDDRSPATPA